MSDAAWRTLVEDFVAGRISGPAFEREFLDLHLAAVNAGERIRYAVDTLFGGVDAYCADPALFGEFNITEDQLRTEAQQALANWDAAWPGLPPPSEEDAYHMARFKRAAAALGLLKDNT